MTTGMDLKIERVRSRVSATRIAEGMGVVRQRISQIVHDELAAAASRRNR